MARRRVLAHGRRRLEGMGMLTIDEIADSILDDRVDEIADDIKAAAEETFGAEKDGGDLVRVTVAEVDTASGWVDVLVPL